MELEPGGLRSLREMLELDARKFIQAVTTLERVKVLIDHDGEKDSGDELSPNLRRKAKRHLQFVLDAVEALGDRSCSVLIKRAINALEGNNATLAELGKWNGEICSRLEDYLSGTKFLYVRQAHADYYDSDANIFGEEVEARFPSLAYEIGEAGKCLALDRSTASVFHSIRCLEAAIKALSRCLGIPDPLKAADRNWGRMLAAIKMAIQSRWPTTTDKMSGDGQFFEDGYAALAAMQNPWRNATMYLDQKYTEEEARHLLEVIGGFMRKVASRCDERGNPKA